MRLLGSLDSIAFADLLDLCRDEEPRTAYPENGSFTIQARNGRDYWYFRGYERPMDGSAGRATLRYVGAAEDPSILKLVDAHGRRHASYKKRNSLASRLRRSGLPAPQPIEGAVTGVLAGAGLFRNGSTLVGSVAFQTYGGLLGGKLEGSGHRTDDLDAGQPPLLEIDPKADPVDILAALKGADPTVEPVFHGGHPDLVAGFANASKFKVGFLTPRRSQRNAKDGALAEFGGLPGIGARTSPYFEYLLKDPVTSVMRHGAGIAVRVPDPMRYATHKLIVAVQRRAPGTESRAEPKAAKDIRQAEAVIEAAAHARATTALGEAWLDAWARGPQWRRLLREGSLRLGREPLHILAAAATEAAILNGTDDPFASSTDPRAALLADPGHRHMAE